MNSSVNQPKPLPPELDLAFLKKETEPILLVSVERRDFFRVVFINRRAEPLLGCLQDVTGKCLTEVLPEKSQEQWKACYKEILHTGRPAAYSKPAAFSNFCIADQVVLTPYFDALNECSYILASIVQNKEPLSFTEQNSFSEEESFLQSFFAHTSDPVSFWNDKKELVAANAAFKTMFGFQPNSLALEKYCSFIPAEEQETDRDFFQCMLQGKSTYSYETKRRHQDGRLIDVTVSYMPARNNEGTVIGGIISFRDISFYKQMEKKLKTAKEQEELVWNHTADAIDMFTLEGRLLQINPAFTNLFGWTESDTLGEKPSIIFTPPHLKEELSFVRRQLQQGVPVVGFETKRQKKDGTLVDVLVTYNPIKNEAKEVWAVVGIYKDLTKQKQVQRKLIESEERYRLIAEHSHDLIKVLDLNGRITYVSPSHEKVLGFKPSELLGNLFLDMVFEEDRPLLKQQFHDFLEGFTMGKAQFRQYAKNGSWIWVEGILTPIRSQAGEIQQYTLTARDITKRKQDEEKLKHHAFYDSLTGVYNRRLSKEILQTKLMEAKRSHSSFAVMYIDIDQFKTINDTFGHEAGDELLVQIANKLKEVTRQNDVLARMGGDEFLLMISEMKEISLLKQVANNIIDSLQKPMILLGQELHVTVSIGISMYPSHGEEASQLLKRADAAMYLAKEKGKNGFQFYTPDLDQQLKRKILIENHLRTAIEHQQFQLVYQPKVDLRTKEVIGAEALLRWEHPELGPISPAEFIPIAEETGQIVSIGTWVLEAACRQSKQWQKEGHFLQHISVNVSVRQFQQDDFVESVKRILTKTALDPHFLELEITESMIQNLQRSFQILQALKQLGIRTSIDDFGTGYSSLSVLKSLPVDVIKLDKSFVDDLFNPANEAIVKMIVEFGDTLGLQVIAEGIEREEQAQLLIGHRCYYGQGYLFGKPVSAREFKRR